LDWKDLRLTLVENGRFTLQFLMAEEELFAINLRKTFGNIHFDYRVQAQAKA
jgi:hypothetical protein